MKFESTASTVVAQLICSLANTYVNEDPAPYLIVDVSVEFNLSISLVFKLKFTYLGQY